jgi:hypothetical protein
MTAPARFRKEDVARAVAGCAKGGMRVGRVEIDPLGRIVIMAAGEAPDADPNPWGKVLGKS